MGPMDYRLYSLFSFSLLHVYFSPPLFCLGKAKLLYSTPYSVLKFIVGLGSLWKSVSASEPASLRNLL